MKQQIKDHFLDKKGDIEKWSTGPDKERVSGDKNMELTVKSAEILQIQNQVYTSNMVG